MKKFLIFIQTILFIFIAAYDAKAKIFEIGIKEDSHDLTVNSKSGPWDPALNKSKNYVYRIRRNDPSSPAIFKVKPGDSLTIECVNGYVNSDWPGYPDRKTDAGGYPKELNTYLGGNLPSFYINDKINHMALIGVFADSKGVIVGEPFLVGNGPLSVEVPQGSERLQLGINDNLFRDNAGLLVVKVYVSN